MLEECSLDRRYLSISALKNGCKLYYSVANSGNYDKTKEEALKRLNQVKADGNLGTDVIVTSRDDILNQYLLYDNLGYYEKYDCYFICDINNSRFVEHCKAANVFAAKLTDDNYTDGISNVNRGEILFQNNKYNNIMLEKAKAIKCNNVLYEIRSIDIDDEWIYVSVDGDASACGYPQELSIIYD